MLKSISDLDAKAVKKQQKKWRENSAKHYRKNKILKDVLDLTPPSDETDVQPGPSRRVLHPIAENRGGLAIGNTGDIPGGPMAENINPPAHHYYVPAHAHQRISPTMVNTAAQA